MVVPSTASSCVAYNSCAPSPVDSCGSFNDCASDLPDMFASS